MPPRQQRAAVPGPQAQVARPLASAPLAKLPDRMAFDSGLFGRWLRMLLMAFYTDEEAVVADCLFRRAAMVKDSDLARFLGLPDRQVRQALERRLVPDCLVERLTEGVAPYTQTFYRICPAAVAVAAQRLQSLEDRLGAVTEDEYSCPQCRRAYDSLQAMSLAKRAFAFLCEDCGVELMAAAESAKVQHDRLNRFRTQCRDLLLLTREIKEMPIPLFKREALERKREAPTASATPSAATPSSGSTKLPQAPAADPRAAPNAAGAASKPSEPEEPQRPSTEWFSREVLGVEPNPRPIDVDANAPRAGETEADVELALEQAKGQLLEERQRRMQQELAGRAAGKGQTVMVQGKAHPLDEARKDEALQDQMTDEEYQRFVDLDRQVHGVKLCYGF